MKRRWLIFLFLTISLVTIQLVSEFLNTRNENGLSWNLIEEDGTFYWKDLRVFIAMILTLAFLIILTFIWLKNKQRKGWKYFLVLLVPIYLISPWIQILLIDLYIFIYEKTYPNATMHLNYTIAWASPIDKAITFGAPPLLALIISLASWRISKKEGIGTSLHQESEKGEKV